MMVKNKYYVMESCVRRGAGSIAFWTAVHGGLGRARRPRAPDPWSGAFDHPGLD